MRIENYFTQMDVSKFALDRNAYLNTAAAIYESTKQQVSSNYSAYLDPSVLTKAYFDSKMYSAADRSGAPNYAFDISKIYGNQSGGQDMNGSQDRDSTPQLDDKSMNESSHMDFNGNGTQQAYQTFASQQQSNVKFETEPNPSQQQQQQQQQQTSGDIRSGGGGGSGGEYRRPLTVIF
jgi:transcription factor SOX1/3/14/21 (SOX group B)